MCKNPPRNTGVLVKNKATRFYGTGCVLMQIRSNDSSVRTQIGRCWTVWTEFVLTGCGVRCVTARLAVCGKTTQHAATHRIRCDRTFTAQVLQRVLTRRDVNAGNRDAALDHRLDDGCHVRLRRRAAEAAAEERVDDDVVGAGDEVRLGRHVRQERDVLQLALFRQTAVERRLARAPREEDRRSIVLPPHAVNHVTPWRIRLLVLTRGRTDRPL